jgi:hypothetical protein
LFIKTYKSGGKEYATLVCARRKKTTGEKFNDRIYQLGRVLDKEKGIYHNKDRGVYRYILGVGFSDIEDQETFLDLSYGRKLEMILDFGREFIFSNALEIEGILKVFTSILPREADTLLSLVLHKMLCNEANSYAEDFWRTSYCRIVYPKARLASQRISEFLKNIGDEAVIRNFFSTYLKHISSKAGTSHHSVLIDSTGLPNDCKMSITATNVHNGVISNEVRLILLMDRKTGYPLYFRYVKGTIVDVNTLKETIEEVQEYGIDVDHCIMDAGYYCEDNIKELNAASIPYVIRLRGGNDIYDKLVEEHVPELDTPGNAVVYGKRVVFIKCVLINNFHGKDAFAYVSIDQEVQAQERAQIIIKASNCKFDTEKTKQYRNSGVFIIVSKIKVDVKEILPLYYTRQAIEQVFDFSKNYANILPLRTHAEATFRGHLLISFMATVAIMTIDRLFLNANPRSKKPKLNFIQARSCLRQMKCNVYNDKIIVIEPDAACNAVIKALKVEFTKIINR